MLEILKMDGYLELTLARLSEVRKGIGLRKRVEPWQEQEVDIQIRSALRQEFDAGTVEDFGREHLNAYMRNKYHIIGRYNTLSPLLVGYLLRHSLVTGYTVLLVLSTPKVLREDSKRRRRIAVHS